MIRLNSISHNFFKGILYFFLFCSVQLFGQSITRLEVITAIGSNFITAQSKDGMLYFSISQFADALSENYKFNKDTKKIKVDFDRKSLVVTAQNPYYVLIDTSANKTQVIQIPVNTIISNNEIYVPMFYTLDIIQEAMGRQVFFSGPNRIILGRSLAPIAENESESKTETGNEKVDTEKVKPEENVTLGHFNISDMTLDEKANGTLIRLKCDKKVSTYNSSYKTGVLTILLKDCSADAKALNRVKDEGLVKEIKVRDIKSDVEIQIKVGKEYSTSEVINASGSNDILITLHNKVFSNNNNREKNKQKWDFDVIVLDAGHGGHDYGAIGVNGVREKDVNLGITLKLGKLLEKNMKDVKVVYTRKTDKFVELYKRGQIANENDGKLFISIHCNSTPKKPTDASGFEVYLLRPGRTKEAISIAERENSVIQYEDNPGRYKALTDENFILVSMAQSSYMKYSEKFSDILNKEFSKDLSEPSRGVKQAGFYVLVGASMPSVLIESGFLSNKKDANYLKSSKGQQAIAESIFKAIKKFKEHYEKAMDSDS